MSRNRKLPPTIIRQTNDRFNVTTRPRGCYGLWECVIALPDGSYIWGGGQNAYQAERNAWLKAAAAK